MNPNEKQTISALLHAVCVAIKGCRCKQCLAEADSVRSGPPLQEKPSLAIMVRTPGTITKDVPNQARLIGVHRPHITASFSGWPAAHNPG